MIKSKLASRHLTIIFCMTLMIVFVWDALAQKHTMNEESGFEIVVESVRDQVALKCNSGCAWKELGYTNNRIQAIDQYGMSSIRREAPKQDAKLANFLFTIEKTADGVNLKGIEGTLWKALSFTCKSGDCNQAINQLGMI